MQKSITFIFLFVFTPFVFAQQKVDTIQYKKDSIEIKTLNTSNDLKFNYKSLIIPTVFIGYGVLSLNNNEIKNWNNGIKDGVKGKNNSHIAIDDFSLFAPTVSVYVLNAFGVKGKHNFKDRSIILGTSALLTIGTTFTIKEISNVQRPDASNNFSFPLGHTAIAFMGAEFLYQEYKDVSPWYGIAGYVVASGTGFLRMYNNRHWFSDVIAGAGIGILCTKMAYWVHPWMKDKIFKDKTNNINGLAMPFYNGKQAGLGLVVNF